MGRGLRIGSRWGSSRCGIIGPPGETQGAGAARGGVGGWGELSLYSQLWWAQGRRGIPVSPWATLAHAQRSSGSMGSGTQPGPSPGSQQPYQVAMTTNTFIPVPLSHHGSAFVNNHNWEVGGRDQPQLGWSCEPQAVRDWRVD